MPGLQITERLAENSEDFFWSDEERDLQTIDTIILHSMFAHDREGDEAYNAEACILLLMNTAPGLSCHYFIDPKGNIFRSVPEANMAWQAGVSKMPVPDGRPKVNAFSVGIEVIGNMKDGFTEAQYTSLVSLVADIMKRLPIENILGHKHIAGPDVRGDNDPKTDPWNFNWPRFLTMLMRTIGNEKFSQMKLLGNN